MELDRQQKWMRIIAIALFALSAVIEFVKRGQTRGFVLLAVFVAVLALIALVMRVALRTTSQARRWALIVLSLGFTFVPFVLHRGTAGLGIALLIQASLVVSVIVVIMILHRRQTHQ